MIMKKNMMACVLLALAGVLMPVGSSASDDFADESRNTVRILEGDNSDPSIVRYGDAIISFTPHLCTLPDLWCISRTTWSTGLTVRRHSTILPEMCGHPTSLCTTGGSISTFRR